jgi:hypothetical protein
MANSNTSGCKDHAERENAENLQQKRPRRIIRGSNSDRRGTKSHDQRCANHRTTLPPCWGSRGGSNSVLWTQVRAILFFLHNRNDDLDILDIWYSEEEQRERRWAGRGDRTIYRYWRCSDRALKQPTNGTIQESFDLNALVRGGLTLIVDKCYKFLIRWGDRDSFIVTTNHHWASCSQRCCNRNQGGDRLRFRDEIETWGLGLSRDERRMEQIQRGRENYLKASCASPARLCSTLYSLVRSTQDVSTFVQYSYRYASYRYRYS